MTKTIKNCEALLPRSMICPPVQGARFDSRSSVTERLHHGEEGQLESEGEEGREEGDGGEDEPRGGQCEGS